jgi:hypothetical protein
MLATRLIQLIENQAQSLTHETVQDVLTNQHTASFRRLPNTEVEPRIAALYHNIGKWIGDPRDEKIRQEYEHRGENCESHCGK